MILIAEALSKAEYCVDLLIIGIHLAKERLITLDGIITCLKRVLSNQKEMWSFDKTLKRKNVHIFFTINTGLEFHASEAMASVALVLALMPLQNFQ